MNKKRFRINSKKISALLAVFVLILNSCFLSGCSSSDTTVSDKKKEQVRLRVNQDLCGQASKASVNFNLGDGTKIDIPSEIEPGECNDVDFYGDPYNKWPLGANQGEVQKKWREAGSKNDCGLPTYNGRYGVVVSNQIAAAGDYLDIVYTDGNVLSAFVVDVKSDQDGAFTYNGVAYGDTISGDKWKFLEWILEPNGLNSGGRDTLASSKISYCLGIVDYVVKYNNLLDSDTAPSNNTGTVSYKGGDAATTKTTSSSTAPSELVGDDTAQQMWNYMKACGLTDAVCAGLLGNAQQESSLNPGASGAAYGLWQFENGLDDSNSYFSYVSRHGGKADDVLTQLNFMFKDGHQEGSTTCGYAEYRWNKEPRNGITGYYGNGAAYGYSPHMDWKDYIQLNDIDQATEMWELIYEAASIPMMEKRKQYAHEFYERFNGTGATAAKKMSEDCEDNEQSSMTGVIDGEQYHQTQGTHAGNDCKDKPTDSEAQGSACGATSFAIGINMLIGKTEYCGVETYYEFKSKGKATYQCGVKDWTDEANSWLTDKKLSDKITAEGSDIKSPEDLKKLLVEGKVVVVSSMGPNYCDNSGSTEGDSEHKNGHYVLFYKYDNGNFIASDPARSDRTAAKYDAEHIKKWFDARDYHTACVLGKK